VSVNVSGKYTAFSFYPEDGRSMLILKFGTNLQAKVKAIPLQVRTGPESSRRMRLTDFQTVGSWRC